MESIQFNTVCGSMLYARPPLRRPLHISESPVESTAHHAHPAGQLPNHPTTARTTAPLARQQTPSNSTFKFKGPAGRPSIARGLLLNQLATWSISINIHAKAPLKTEESTASVARSMIMRRRGGAVASAAWVVLGVAVAAASAALLLADAAHDYEEALRKSLVYFEAQRSGRLPHGQRVAWRDHSGLTDGLEQGVDLVGGYYDAGDHVKFGLPMAFTVTMLSWSLLEYGADVAAAGELAHALESIKWGTDYFIKAHTQPDELWAEVGDGDTDHYCWQRPEDMTTSRQAYKVDRDRPGSDVAGETAAALAAASMAFRDTNPHYAHLLLHHAQQLFEFADKYRGKYDSSIAEVKSYYASVSGYHDELLWAALWLHRATGRASYLDYVVDNADAFGGTGWAITEFSWDVKYAGVQILATRLLLLQGEHTERQRETLEGYRAKAEHYVCACMGKNNNENNNVERSPGGMLYVRQWNNMQYVTSAAFLLSVYSGYLTEAGGGSESVACGGGVNGEKVGAEEVFSEAKAQVDYVLGSNPRGMSYLVGYGAKYPTRVHHRAASIVPYKDAKAFIGCAQGFDDWFGRRSANPNVVVGAIVGGPDRKDRFRDDRDNYMQTEACTYNTAPMVGIFAMLHRLQQEESSPSSATATLQPENGGTSSTATATG
ncbi:endoglucanase 16 [Brachypodium distachyon]|nr:endoglucanase 16 [Brachypodium distachyon]|eukprot:XP_003564003.2 endoglucanase 16 [Brachypodium distachyon]